MGIAKPCSLDYLYRHISNMLRLNPNSPVPLHSQVEQILRKRIAQKEYQENGLLPDELTLANRFGVSRGTMRVAIASLVQEGVLERRAGVGTRVRPRPVESGIRVWRSFSRDMARMGIQVENLKLEYALKTPTEEAAAALQLPRRVKIWRLDRVRGWNGQPVLHSRSWFHSRLDLKGDEDFSKPLYATLRGTTGVQPERAHEAFGAVPASKAMASLLRVSAGEPLLLRTHTVFDSGGRAFEFSQVHYVSSRFSLTMDLRRDEDDSSALPPQRKPISKKKAQ
jgi:GntR family transcriptional regulator